MCCAAGSCLVLSCLLILYTAVMSFEILFPFGLWVSEPGWLLNHSQLHNPNTTRRGRDVTTTTCAAGRWVQTRTEVTRSLLALFCSPLYG